MLAHGIEPDDHRLWRPFRASRALPPLPAFLRPRDGDDRHNSRRPTVDRTRSRIIENLTGQVQALADAGGRESEGVSGLANCSPDPRCQVWHGSMPRDRNRQCAVAPGIQPIRRPTRNPRGAHQQNGLQTAGPSVQSDGRSQGWFKSLPQQPCRPSPGTASSGASGRQRFGPCRVSLQRGGSVAPFRSTSMLSRS